MTVKWKDHAILDGPDTIVYIDFDEVEVTSTIIIMPDLFECIEEWGKAWDTVNYNIKKEEEQNAGSSGKSTEKGKATQWTRSKPYTTSDFPWELRLAKLENTSTARAASQKRRQEEDDNVMKD